MDSSRGLPRLPVTNSTHASGFSYQALIKVPDQENLYMRAIIETRSQKASGRAWPSKGPGKYVAVQLVPDGVQPLEYLREDMAKKRGIEIIRCGEYYWNSTGPRSRYAKAMAEAERIAAKYK